MDIAATCERRNRFGPSVAIVLHPGRRTENVCAGLFGVWLGARRHYPLPVGFACEDLEHGCEESAACDVDDDELGVGESVLCFVHTQLG